MLSFKVMTWNVENLARPANPTDVAAQTIYKGKLDLLAGVIKGQEPDIIGLQELWGDEPLGDLQCTLGGAYPHLMLSAYPDGRGIRVGFLSKHAFDTSEDIVVFPPGAALDIKDIDVAGGTVPVTRMGRGALRVRVSKNGLTVDVVTTHLKSKLLSYPRPGGSSFSPKDEGERAQVAGIAILKRTAEAVTLRLRINALLGENAETPLVLMGDFNDVPDVAPRLESDRDCATITT